jgi:peptidoglycan/LPS O-acetylase OafA/YrhL
MSATERRQSIDLLRFVAAFGIVWAHMQAPYMVEGYVALALFLILTAFLSVRSLARGGVKRFWLGRLWRFFLPWVLWSAVFAALNVLRGGWTTLIPDNAGRLLIGPVIHLWFLPFVIFASPLVILALWVLTSPARVWVAALGAVPLAVATIRAHDQGGLAEPLAQWAFATMPLLYGLLSAAGQHHRAVAAPVVFAGLSCGIATYVFGSPTAPYLVAAALLFEAVWRARLPSQQFAHAAALAFGIYLIHPFFMLVWYHVAGPDHPASIAALVVFAASALATALIRLVPAGRVIT